VNSRLLRSIAVPLLAAVFATAPAGASADPVLDIQALRLVELPPDRVPDRSLDADLAILGGGLGGVAATLAACDLGLEVILCEETSWLGGQATSQGVSVFDDNPWVDHGGSTLRYQELRRALRERYLKRYELVEGVEPDLLWSPGMAWAGRFACEPRAVVEAIDAMLAEHEKAGRLRVLRRHKACRVGREGDRFQWVDALDLEGGELLRLNAPFYLDATELGDLLALGGVEHRTGRESRAETGEPHALEGEAAPECSQAFTYCFILEHRPGEDHTIAKPDSYEVNRKRQPLREGIPYLNESGETRYKIMRMFKTMPDAPGSFWTYRRIIDSKQFAGNAFPHDIALINWASNDYREGDLLTATPAEALGHLQRAKALSFSFLYWLQQGMRRDRGGGRGYPELMLAKDQVGTDDGLAMHPYIRESRRIVALDTVVEQDIVVDASRRSGEARARFRRDAVGIGYYKLDIHPGVCPEPLLDVRTLHYQIPLGAMVPRRVENLLPACKNIGTTHITSSGMRLHPVEWAIGEAAGNIAAACMAETLTPQQLHADSLQVLALQEKLVQQGIPIYWYTGTSPRDDVFAQAQLEPFRSEERRGELERVMIYYVEP
jgi:hypothetical protein